MFRMLGYQSSDNVQQRVRLVTKHFKYVWQYIELQRKEHVFPIREDSVRIISEILGQLSEKNLLVGLGLGVRLGLGF